MVGERHVTIRLEVAAQSSPGWIETYALESKSR